MWGALREGISEVSSIIVLEQSPRFQGELQTQWSLQRGLRADDGDAAISSVESARSVSEVISFVDAKRKGVVVADLAVGHPDVLRLLEGWNRSWPIVVVGPREIAELEWPLRELGATSVLFEPVKPLRLLAMCQRVIRVAA